MNIEEEIFKKSHIIFEKLEEYGFIKKGNNYYYLKNFMNNEFKSEITITKEGQIKGKVIDKDFNEEYTGIRVENYIGQFANQVKEEYKNILLDIKNKCTTSDYFIYPQTNRIQKYIQEKYESIPEFLWERTPGCGVFRNKKNKKWYGIIMNINQNKLNKSKDKEIEIINIKLKESKIKELLKKDGFYPGYHMSKDNWITILLDDTLKDNEIKELIDESYKIINTPNEWIIPANLKYYDIISDFQKRDIVEWKQSSNIQIGDIIYMYVADPISAIIYKCIAIETDIPYNYKDKNLKIDKLMKIKLLKEYPKDKYSFKYLNTLGITSIRGPRKISKEISKNFE